MDEKLKLAWEDPRANRGYVAPGRERVTNSTDPAEIAALRAKAPDSKETMEIGRDWDTTWRNQWPKEALVPNFKHTMREFFQVSESPSTYSRRETLRHTLDRLATSCIAA